MLIYNFFMIYILKFEEWLGKLSTLKVFNSSEISRWEFLASILIVWSIPIFFVLVLNGVFILEEPWSNFERFFLSLFTLFLIILFQPIFILKRLRRAYGERIYIKEFHLFSLKVMKVPTFSLSTEKVTITIFCLQIFSSFLSGTTMSSSNAPFSEATTLYLMKLNLYIKLMLSRWSTWSDFNFTTILFVFIGSLICLCNIYLIFCKDTKKG